MENDINNHPYRELLSEVMSSIFSHEELITPVYVNDFYCSSDSQYLNEYPLIYIWTSQDTGNAMSSVNGNGISKILESFIPKNDQSFMIVRDALIVGLSEASRDAMKSLCETRDSNPQDIFANYSINTLKNATITRSKDLDSLVLHTGFKEAHVLKKAKSKIYIDCPYNEKEEAKEYGAKWDREKRQWYIPTGIDISPFAKWLIPQQLSNESLAKPQQKKKSQKNKPEKYLVKLLEYWLYALEYSDLNKLSESKLALKLREEELLSGKINSQKLIDQIFEAYKDDAYEGENLDEAPVRILFGFFDKKSDKKGQVLVSFPCILNLDGSLKGAASMWPRVNKAYLEAKDHGGRQLVIGTQDDVEEYLDANSPPSDGSVWKSYLGYLNDLFLAVTSSGFIDYKHPSYNTPLAFKLIYPDNNDARIINLRALYRVLINKEHNTSPLLAKICNGILPKESIENIALSGGITPHSGHMDYKYSLDSSQRKALNHFLQLKDGQLQAVNGPPGTGKTTLLRDVVASTWVNATVVSENPVCPIIIASAATNQAVTNIIGSFGVDVVSTDEINIQTRWIKNIGSYGWFFPAISQSSKAKWQEFQLLMRKSSGKNDWSYGGIISGLNDINKGKLQKTYIKHYNSVFIDEQHSHIDGILTNLHRKLSHVVKDIEPRLIKLLNNTLSLLSVAPYKAYSSAVKAASDYAEQKKQSEILFTKNVADIQQRLAAVSKLYGRISFFIKRAKGIQKRSLWSYLIPFIYEPLQKIRKQKLLGDLHLESDIPLNVKHYDFYSIQAELEKLAESLSEKLANFKKKLVKYSSLRKTLADRYDQKLSSLDSFLKGYQEISQFFDELTDAVLGYSISDHGVKLDSLIHDLKNHKVLSIKQGCNFAKRFQGVLDCTVRTWSFHLTARYWEGRWLLAAGKCDGPDDLTALVSKLREFCMLAPCVVATFYTLPKLLMLGSPKSMPKIGINVADLLIIDEAGQASPEISIPAFALAKKSIVVGDLEQLKPVWSFDNSDDLSMLEKMGLRDSEHELTETGKRVHGGSTMLMAHSATTYSEQISGGILLRYHYRCEPTIIEFCNELVYDGQLIPIRNENCNSLFFPMSFVKCQASVSRSGGSWKNTQEAYKIAQWLFEKKDIIEAHYTTNDESASIIDLVAIVVPYGAQILEIRRAIADLFQEDFQLYDNNDDDKKINTINGAMTIGTIHTLQGAERPIVIFSSVSTPEQSSTAFIDRDTDMLNVAVSRAKDAFILFGHPELFFSDQALAINNTSPSAKLGKYLTQHGKRLFPRNIVAVESPSKAEAIGRYLGCDYKVIATTGHFRDLDFSSNSLDFNNKLRPKWTIDSKKENMLQVFVEHLSDADKLILATDDDREGEAIAWHVKEVLSSRMALDHIKLERIRFSSITKHDIEFAIAHASSEINLNRVRAALARNIIDYILGKKLSEFLSKKALEKNDLKEKYSIGRVQSALLYLIRDRDNEVNSFVPHKLFSINFKFEFNSNQLKGYISDSPDYFAQPMYFQNEADALKSIKQISVAEIGRLRLQMKYTEQQLSFGSYPGMTTARVLSDCYESYGILPIDTMKAMQSLYDGSYANEEIIEKGQQ